MNEIVTKNDTSNLRSLIVSKWTEPIEAFTPHPKFTQPLLYAPKKHINFILHLAKSVTDSEKELILAHETNKENAENIIKKGFNLEEKGFCALRDKAIFGWIHKSDVGYYANNEYENTNYIVLFTVPKNKVFVSSYNTSAKQLILGDITNEEYEYKHVLPYKEYESILHTKPSLVEHLKYNKESLLN